MYVIFINAKKSSLFVQCGLNTLRLSRKARSMLAGDQVQLLWDQSARRAALCAADSTSTDTYTINKGNSISCCHFLKSTGLRGIGKLPASWDTTRELIEWSIPAKSPQADAAPAGDGSIGGGQRADTAADTTPRSLSPRD